MELRKFGLMMAFILIFVFGLSLPLLFGKPFPISLWVIGGIFLLLALIKPSLLKPIYIGWMKVGHILGFINTRIILGVIFFALITPVGLIMRLFGNDPMNKRYDEKLTSYRKKVHPTSIHHMEKPF